MSSNSPSAELLLADGLSREFLIHHGICPRRRSASGAIVVAVSPSAHLHALDDIAFAYGAPAEPEAARGEEVERLIERLCANGERRIELAQAHDVVDDYAADVRDLANQPPVIRYVNLLVREAYDAAASDIHLE